MSELLILSDSHGRLDRINEVLARNGARRVIFLGDGIRDIDAAEIAAREVYAGRGNCDWCHDMPEEDVEIFDGCRVFFTHGHKYGVKSGLGAALVAAAARDADVLLYGHTHRAFEKTYKAGTVLGHGDTLKKPLLVICPGAIGDRPATFATLTIAPNGLLAGFGEL